MKNVFSTKYFCFLLLLSLLLFNEASSFAQENTKTFWTEIDAKKLKKKNKKVVFPTSYRAFTLDGEKLKFYLKNAPDKDNKNISYLLNLPLPNGEWATFSIYKNTVLSEELAKKYSDTNTFDAVNTSKNTQNGKLDYTPLGFHALLFSTVSDIYIQPVKTGNLTHYIVFYKKDAVKKNKYIYESNN